MNKKNFGMHEGADVNYAFFAGYILGMECSQNIVIRREA